MQKLDTMVHQPNWRLAHHQRGGHWSNCPIRVGIVCSLYSGYTFCPKSIPQRRFSPACSNVQLFQFRTGDSGVSINSAPASLHFSPAPRDDNSFGLILHGIVWYSMVWFGLGWYGMVWFGKVKYGMIWSVEFTRGQ